MTGYTPAGQDIRAARGLPYATGADDPPGTQPEVTGMTTCEANIGLYLGGAVSVEDSLAGSWGCPDNATVILRGACVHEHVKQKQFCAMHGQVAPSDGVWLCLACAQAGHDCPMTVEEVAPGFTGASDVGLPDGAVYGPVPDAAVIPDWRRP